MADPQLPMPIPSEEAGPHLNDKGKTKYMNLKMLTLTVSPPKNNQMTGFDRSHFQDPY